MLALASIFVCNRDWVDVNCAVFALALIFVCRAELEASNCIIVE